MLRWRPPGRGSFHFVIGGTTPAALGADWLATTLDQMVYAWVASPLATRLEQISLKWLQDLFWLPQSWQGVMTTGATMANFVCLAAARQWYGERLGVDVAEQGLGKLPELNIFSSGIIHPSDVKVLSMLGMGRASVQRLAANDTGEFDLEALEQALKKLKGKPAIIIAVAGEPNAGMFDPIDRLADLAAEYGAWLHVDGAFGLFAALSPEHAGLVRGVERAHSAAVDGHKWLNVPYDCGFAFVQDAALAGESVFPFGGLPARDDRSRAGAGDDRPGDVAAGALPGGVGHAQGVRQAGHPAHGGAKHRHGAVYDPADRGSAGPGAAGGRAAQCGLFSLPPGRRPGRAARMRSTRPWAAPCSRMGGCLWGRPPIAARWGCARRSSTGGRGRKTSRSS